MEMALSRADLRQRLDRVLLTDSDLDAFLLDYFPHIKRRMAIGIDRKAKINLLFELEIPERILDALHQSISGDEGFKEVLQLGQEHKASLLPSVIGSTDLSKYPLYHWHCKIRLEKKRAKDPDKQAIVNDLTREQLWNTIIQPYLQGKNFVIDGMVVTAKDKIEEIKVFQTEKMKEFYQEIWLARNERAGIAMIYDTKRLPFDEIARGHDYTHELLFSRELTGTVERKQSTDIKEDLGGMPAMRVFISHSSKDKGIAEAFINLLIAAFRLPAKDIRCTSVDGYRLPAGSDASDQLRQEVFDADVFIALLSPTSIQSVYVMFELGARWGARKHLIPILINGFSASSLKAPLSAIHSVNGIEQGEMHQLLADIGTLLHLQLELPAAYFGALNNFTKSAT